MDTWSSSKAAATSRLKAYDKCQPHWLADMNSWNSGEDTWKQQ